VIRKTLYVLPIIAAALVVAFALGDHRHAAKPAGARHILYYQDPMHPAYRSDKPGTAPDCGMDLEPVYSDSIGQAPPGSASGVAQIDSTAQQLYGIKVAKVEKGSGQGAVRVFARVEPDDTRVYRVNFGTDGFVKETHGDAVGEHVAKDQHLAVVYSPEFLAVAGGYLAANEHSQGASSAAKDNSTSTPTQGAASVQARADRLRNLGMSDSQINEISKSRTLPEDVYVVSPTDGFILTRNISSGMRFEKHADLYTVADLSHVWIVAEVLGRDAKAFRPGATARVTLPDTDESFRATVSKVLPEVDPVTRSLKLRLEADNPGFKLRPNMFVNVELPVSLPDGITVPVDAVIDSGESKRVFVQTAAGHFEARTVETGWQMDQRVQIVKGLQEGETVVSAGTFLVDSESRLQLTAKASGPTDNVRKATAALDHHVN
jgi:Cu(I)/Ag(I) efflux system membrane fusion protein